MKKLNRSIHLVAALLLIGAGRGLAQTPQQAALSLDEAIRIARDQSEQVAIANAGVLRARGQQYQARSQYFPQVFGSLAYTRTLQSEFSALQDSDTTTTSGGESCGSFTPNPGLPLSERIDSLEAAVKCKSNENPFSAFRNLPFGREHQVNLGLVVSQNVFTGGRIQAQNRIASSARKAAEINVASTDAQLMLDVTEAYYNAALTDRLVAIAEATLQQSETTLSQVKLARQVGDKPEFELLRAQVTRDNQQPIVIQRRSDRDVAYMRLKQLLNIPLERNIRLSTSLGDDVLPATVVQASNANALADTITDARAPVRQAAENVRVQDAQRRIALAERLPSLSLSSQYGRVGYPTAFGFPAWSDFRQNWTVSATLQLPIFTGGRLQGDAMVARAGLDEARARLQQTRELAALDTRSAVERLASAEAAWRASSGTVEQASKAYQIAEIRFKEGISTQLELSDSRILLQQAEANRALTARDLQVARARIALLKDLPLGAGAGSTQLQLTTTPTSQVQPIAPQTTPQTQQTTTRTATGLQTSTVGN